MAEKLSQASQKLLNVFSEYQIRALGVMNNDDRRFSEPLTFLRQLVNVSFEDSPRVPLLPIDYSSYLPNRRLFFNARSGTIEIRSFDQKADNKKFAAMLSLKIYADHSFAGMLDGLCRLPLEMVITQSFRFLDAHVSKKALKDQYKDFEQIHDESITQTEQLKESLDEVASGESGLGFHHLSILCTSPNLERLNSSVAEIVSYFSNLDMACIREDLACELSFWAQLPGNFAYIPRASKISTKNLAGFMSFHNAPLGKAKGNFWGEAVTILETTSGSPYYFNFHNKDVGVCLCFGAMGSGKTTLLGFLLTQSLKYGGKRIFFDKDRGLEILVRALNGIYETLTPGISTGFNPCKLSDTPENRTFLHQLFKKMLTVHEQAFDESDAETVSKIIHRLYELPEDHRQLQHLAPYFGIKKKGSLRQRFEQWHSEGSLAWLFDNENDSLNLEAEVLGFDLGKILENKEVKTPALMYLMHRVSQTLEGQRGGIFIDEGWQALDDAYFKEIINDFARTPRKKNNFICLATQSAEDTVKSAISIALNEAASAKFFFPNPAAKPETYIQHFGLKAREVSLIQTMDNSGHYVLLNAGQGKESVIVRANLEGLDDEIAVISGRESTVKLLDKIRQNVGDHPKDWMPIFLDWYKRADQYV